MSVCVFMCVSGCVQLGVSDLILAGGDVCSNQNW